MYQDSDIVVGAARGSAALAPDLPLFRGAAAAPSQPASAFGAKPPNWRDRLAGIDLVVDLGQRIGSPEWLRGFATCAGLCYAAWWLGPGFQPLPGISPVPFGDVQFEEARALAIAPLAYGADTGRRRAPTDAVEALAESPERPIIDLRATFGRGDSFAGLLERAGVASAEARTAAQLIGAAVPVDAIRPGTVMDLTLG
ncbi:MAG TPA: M23 family peptidase, partial [Allosphingosinicella sp.]|nr:M23 family peptidase [Allosphingosinicella sp.]